MAKFRVKFKIQSLEFEMEGERDSIPLVKHALGQQIAGLLKPVDAVVESPSAREQSPSVEVEAGVDGNGAKRRKSTRAPGRKGDEKGPSVAVDFQHDPERWGTPKQTWSVQQKTIWLLYAIQQQSGKHNLPAVVIVKTFNKHFKEAGLLELKNIYRDLRALKMKTPSPVGEDTTKARPEWFLTDEGSKQGAALVELSLRGAQATSS